MYNQVKNLFDKVMYHEKRARTTIAYSEEEDAYGGQSTTHMVGHPSFQPILLLERGQRDISFRGEEEKHRAAWKSQFTEPETSASSFTGQESTTPRKESNCLRLGGQRARCGSPSLLNRSVAMARERDNRQEADFQE